MKQKFLALALTLLLALSLAACGNQGSASSGNTPDTDAPEVEAPEATPPDDGAPEEAAPETDAPEVDSPEASAPEGNPPEAGTPEAPEGSGSQQGVDLGAFYQTLREEATWPELMSLEDETLAELLDNYYPGLSEISTKQRNVYIAAISAAVGEIALVEVENTEDVQKVKDIFQARIDYQVGDDANPGGAWYPETIEGWKTKSHIASNGNFIMLAVGNAAGDAVERFNQLFA